MTNEVVTTQRNTALQHVDQLPSAPTGETASTAVAAQAKALVEARYTVAFRRPRDFDQVRQNLLKECRRPTFAAVARYRKPIGKGVEGPSIRFAEAAIRCMTNITVETMTVYDDREKRIVRVAVTDLESNVPYSIDVTIEKTIERKKFKEGDVVIRSRTNSYGETVHLLEATEDDILNKQNALISKAIRTQGMRHIPGDLVDECTAIIKETLKKADAQDPDAAKRRLFDAFGDIGVSAEAIKRYLGHDAATLTPKELDELRTLYAGVRDGETTWKEIMDNRIAEQDKQAAGATPTKLKDAVRGKSGGKQQESSEEKGPAITAQEVHDALASAATLPDLEAAQALIDQLPEGQRNSLLDLYTTRKDELSFL